MLRINTEEMQVEMLLDAPVADAISLMLPDAGGRRYIPIGRLFRKPPVRSDIKAVTEVSFQGYAIKELETGTIEVLRDGVPLAPVKPVLRELAIRLNVGLINSSGNLLNAAARQPDYKKRSRTGRA